MVVPSDIEVFYNEIQCTVKEKTKERERKSERSFYHCIQLLLFESFKNQLCSLIKKASIPVESDFLLYMKKKRLLVIENTITVEVM